MTDIDESQRRVMTNFGVYQMRINPAGIGNECTHWVYAALFEARALDQDRALHIGQGRPPYSWGRLVGADGVQRGDIAQFHGFQTSFFLYTVDGTGRSTWFSRNEIRGPNHTGIVFTTPRSGRFFQLESHLHSPGIPMMKVRGNTIYHEALSVAMSAGELAGLQGTPEWPKTIDTTDQHMEDLREKVDWGSVRQRYGIDRVPADRLVARIRARTAPNAIRINDKEIAFLFVVRVNGSLRFFCPQTSPARLAMTETQRATEKASLITSMIRSGRRGEAPDGDEFGADNKQRRVRDNRFDWSYQRP